MKRVRLAHAALMLALLVQLWGKAVWPQAPEKSAEGSQSAAIRNRIVYDGGWWLKASELSQFGFLNGIGDYFVSVNRAKWVEGSIEYGMPKITEYYKRAPRNMALLVPDVWKRVLTESPPPPPLPGGEVYEGPHGYYDGSWYVMLDPEERRGYLQAYMWCLRTYGKQPAAAYPRNLGYYDGKIWNYIHTRQAYNEPAAGILARFRSVIPN